MRINVLDSQLKDQTSCIEMNISVLVIDMQPHFLDELEPEIVKDLIKSQKKVLEYCLEKDVFVATVESNDKTYYGETVLELRQIINKLKRKDLLYKKSISAFNGTKLNTSLSDRNIECLLLMGIYSDSENCVSDTKKDAVLNGYDVLTSRDLIAPFWKCSTFDSYKSDGHFFGNYKEALAYMDGLLCQK